MNIGLKLEITYAADEGSDLFVFVKSAENNDEVCCTGLTFKQILDESFAGISNERERLELIAKVKASMVDFMKDLLLVEENNRKNTGS